MILRKEHYFRYTSYLVYTILFIFVLLKGSIYLPDSYSFLNLDFHRAVGYKLISQTFSSAFGDDFHILLVGLQYFLLVFSSYQLSKTIKDIFQLHIIFAVLLLLVILVPAFYLQDVVNRILSEGVCYPLFLFFMNFTIKGFILNHYSNYIKALLILLLLILTRGQFLALIPLLLIILSIDTFKNGWAKKRILIFVLAITLPLISNLIEKTYNYINYNQFEKTPFNHVSLLAPVMFVSDKSDIEIFSTEDEQNLFRNSYKSLDSLGLVYTKIKNYEGDIYHKYHHNYSSICNLSIHETGLEYYKVKGLDHHEQLIAINDAAGTMFYPLFKNNFKKWLNLYQLNLSYAFGSKRMILFFAVILMSSFLFILKNKKKELSKFIFLITLSVFANHTIVALAAHSIKRYLFYTDWIIFAIIIVLLNEVFLKKLSNGRS